MLKNFLEMAIKIGDWFFISSFADVQIVFNQFDKKW